MPIVRSRNFGAIEYVAGDPFDFPHGLPGFPSETALLPVEVPEQFPLLYLQSLQTPDLCFVALPVRCIVADYQLTPNAEDLTDIGLSPNTEPGPEMLCLALVCFAQDGKASANLRAPLIINTKSHVGVQVVQSDDRYPFRFLLEAEREVMRCS